MIATADAYIGVDKAEHRARMLDRICSILPQCYGIVETLISGLVECYSTNGIEDNTISYKVLLQMKQTFSELFLTVAETLSLCRDFMTSQLFAELQAQNWSLMDQYHLIVCATLRLFGAWMAEDPECFEEQYVHLIPFLVCYKPASSLICKSTSVIQEFEPAGSESDGDSHKTPQATDAVDGSLDPLHFLLPGLLQVSESSNASTLMVTNGQIILEMLAHYVAFAQTEADFRTDFLNMYNLTNLRTGFSMYLRQKWPNQERDQVWKVINGLLHYTSCSWALKAVKDSSSCSENNFASFLLKLVVVEV